MAKMQTRTEHGCLKHSPAPRCGLPELTAPSPAYDFSGPLTAFALHPKPSDVVFSAVARHKGERTGGQFGQAVCFLAPFDNL